MRLKNLPALRSVKKLLSFDFDDTLYNWEGEERICRAFFDAIVEIRETEEVLWGINTGRSYDFLKEGYEVLAQAPFAPDFVITRERDIHIADENGYLRPYIPWNKSCADEHHALFLKYRNAMNVFFAGLEEQFPSVGWWHQQEDEYSIEVESPSDLDEIACFIDEFVSLHNDLSVQRAGPYLRFCHAEFNKGTALRQVLQLFGVEEQNAFIMGDSHNDMDTLKINPLAFCACPSNAILPLKELVKQRNGYISNQAFTDGVLEALGFYFKDGR